MCWVNEQIMQRHNYARKQTETILGCKQSHIQKGQKRKSEVNKMLNKCRDTISKKWRKHKSAD